MRNYPVVGSLLVASLLICTSAAWAQGPDPDETGAKSAVAGQLPQGVELPAGCVATVAEHAGDGSFAWNINCGRERNRHARATLGPVLKEQGWGLCESGLVTAVWWKNGTMSTIVESSSRSFVLRQAPQAKCF